MADPGSPTPASPAEIRADLERRVVADLLGPADGPHELLAIGSRRVRDRYLVGMLAPNGTVWDDPELIGDDDNSEGGDDHDETQRPPAKPVLTPSSIGLSFSVEAGIDDLVATASWGHYERVSERGDDGQAVRGWQRTPVESRVPIALGGDGMIGPLPTPADELVVLEGRWRTMPSGCRLITLFLRNLRAEPPRSKDSAWLFQAMVSVDAVDGGAVFVGRAEAMETAADTVDGPEGPEMALLNLQYRDRVEFAIGHGVGTHAVVSERQPRRATRVATAVVPRHEVAATLAPSPSDRPELAGVVLDMKVLAECSDAELRDALRPLADGYRAWLDTQRERVEAGERGLEQHPVAAAVALAQAEPVAMALAAGIELICTDARARDAFRFANRAMWQQRVRSEAISRRRNEPALTPAEALTFADVAGQRSWRPFQLAFLCMNAPSLTHPDHPDRTTNALVDLLFFPTGGGKTEAYLGLVAFTFAMRRLQGTVNGYDGTDGVAVLMRYTLRALTAQQFERAAALVCACEMIRVTEPVTWGPVPFRLGMWVGSGVTPNRRSDVIQAVRDARKSKTVRQGNPLQLTACPWCGAELRLAEHVSGENKFDRTFVYCGDELGACPFTKRQRPNEGLPVVTVDEEIYRLLPAFVIATVDKFAQLPWKGPLAMLFGRVDKRCERHGYRSDALDRDLSELREPERFHPADGALPQANAAVACGPLRPPDLIIQDELHLITGPLGTLAGLYEAAVDRLASWPCAPGTTTRPKVVASTATIRRAGEQAFAVFHRQLRLFPPPVLDIDDTFFARQLPVTPASPGRAYLGICAHGRRLKEVENRVFATVMAAAQATYEHYGAQADPWMTTVGYFNAIRELAGMKRLADDELRKRLQRSDRIPGLASRVWIDVKELTSRVSSTEIRTILDRLRTPFDPTAGTDADRPVDLVLATNMISVGVDVPRLGLLVAVGQPKSTAEYIQATSRVGRSAAGPGLVITLYNWTRPRDLSHYETFEHFHDTFYRQVEPLSVTPFSAGARDKGLTAVLIGLLRHTASARNPAEGVRAIDRHDPDVAELVGYLAERAGDVAADNTARHQIRSELHARLDDLAIKQTVHGGVLTYEREAGRKGTEVRLLKKAEEGPWERWTCPMSLRETEPGVNLLIEPKDPTYHLHPPYTFVRPPQAGKARVAPVTASHDELADAADDAPSDAPGNGVG